MKKSLIAIAVVGAFSAPAFADTTIYGLVDGAIANVSNTNQRSQTLAVSGGLATSRLGVKGSEDLGGGLKAVYNLEYALDIASNTGVGSVNIGSGTVARQQLLGLADSWGTVAIGRLQTTGKDFGDKFDPFSGSDVSALNNLTSKNLIGSTAVAARGSRAIAYISPDMSGFKFNVNYVTTLNGLGNAGVSNAAADNNTTAALVSGYYDNGPISVALVYAAISSPTSAVLASDNNNRKDWALGGSYDFGMAKVFATYQQTKNDAQGNAGNNNNTWSLSGLIPAGAGNVALSYAKNNQKVDTSGNSDASSYSLAYLYGLSKTTTLYVADSRVGNNSAGAFSVLNGAVAAGQGASASSNVFALGVSKKF